MFELRPKIEKFAPVLKGTFAWGGYSAGLSSFKRAKSVPNAAIIQKM